MKYVASAVVLLLVVALGSGFIPESKKLLEPQDPREAPAEEQTQVKQEAKAETEINYTPIGSSQVAAVETEPSAAPAEHPIQRKESQRPKKVVAKTQKNEYLVRAFDMIRSKANVEGNVVDQALLQFEVALSKKQWAQDNQQEWTRAAQALLQLSLGVKNDPHLARELLSSLKEKNSAPESMKPVLTTWYTHVREWTRQAKSKPTLEQVTELLNRADEIRKKEGSVVALVLYLRSEILLRQIMESSDSSKKEDLSLLVGRAADGLKDQESFSSYFKK